MSLWNRAGAKKDSILLSVLCVLHLHLLSKLKMCATVHSLLADVRKYIQQIHSGQKIIFSTFTVVTQRNNFFRPVDLTQHRDFIMFFMFQYRNFMQTVKGTVFCERTSEKFVYTNTMSEITRTNINKYVRKPLIKCSI